MTRETFCFDISRKGSKYVQTAKNCESRNQNCSLNLNFLPSEKKVYVITKKNEKRIRKKKIV